MSVRRSSTLSFVASSIAATALVPLLGLFSAQAAEPVPYCSLSPATIIGGTTGVVRGTEGPDVIISSGARVDALGGDDLVCQRGEGQVHDDLGPGDDYYQLSFEVNRGSVTGAGGSDQLVLLSGPRDDQRDGQYGLPADRVALDLKADKLAITRGAATGTLAIIGIERYSFEVLEFVGSGGPGRDEVDARACNVTWRAGGGNDELTMKSPLRLIGQDGCDSQGATINMGPGNDRLVDARSTNDTLLGGAGKDKILAEGGINHISGGSGSDFLSGGRQRDDLNGGSGNDTLNGMQGPDHADGGAGRDVCRSVVVKKSCER